MARTSLVAPLVLTALLALALPAGAIPPPPCSDDDPCGVVEITPCATATAQGAAVGIVHWELVVTNAWGVSVTSFDGPAAALATSLACATNICWTATLYANGRQVARDGLCMDV